MKQHKRKWIRKRLRKDGMLKEFSIKYIKAYLLMNSHYDLKIRMFAYVSFTAQRRLSAKHLLNTAS